MKWLLRLALVLIAGFVLMTLSVVLVRPLVFPYAYAAAGFTLRTDTSVNRLAAEAWLEEVARAVAKSPLGPIDGPVTIYSARKNWVQAIYFASVRRAGALYYPTVTPRSVYLKGVDPKGDSLITEAGPLAPPRTLTFYALHEIAHMRTLQTVGLRSYISMPQWAREGVADYVALGPFLGAETTAFLALDRVAMSDRETHGSYPQARALVTHFLHAKGWTFDQLFATSLTRAEARARIGEEG